MKRVPATPEGIAEAAALIRAGEVVAYPTETVYGLGADPFSDTAVERLFEVKGRARDKAVLLIVADMEQLTCVAAHISPRAQAYMEAFWPGPLSLVLPSASGLPDLLTGGSPTICVRCPACETARALCLAVGGPITSTSANLSGQEPARDLTRLNLPGVALAIDGGILPPSAPSTIIEPESGAILRQGAIKID